MKIAVLDFSCVFEFVFFFLKIAFFYFSWRLRFFIFLEDCVLDFSRRLRFGFSLKIAVFYFSRRLRGFIFLEDCGVLFFSKIAFFWTFLEDSVFLDFSRR